jgi:hypothetical protein
MLAGLDAASGITIMQISHKGAVVPVNPEFSAVIHNAVILEFAGGSDPNKIATRDDRDIMQDDNPRYILDPKIPHAFAVAVHPLDEAFIDRSCFDKSGRFSGDSSNGDLHYALADAYSQFWGWGRNADNSVSPDTPPQNNTNTVMFFAPQYVSSINGDAIEANARGLSGTSHLGDTMPCPDATTFYTSTLKGGAPIAAPQNWIEAEWC